MAVRLWAVRTLGRWFTTVVRVAPDQQVVAGGPYRWVRHPSYLGLLLTLAGLGLMLSDWLLLASAVLLPRVVRRGSGPACPEAVVTGVVTGQPPNPISLPSGSR